jgi:hypothetical protein
MIILFWQSVYTSGWAVQIYFKSIRYKKRHDYGRDSAEKNMQQDIHSKARCFEREALAFIHNRHARDKSGDDGGTYQSASV